MQHGSGQLTHTEVLLTFSLTDPKREGNLGACQGKPPPANTPVAGQRARSPAGAARGDTRGFHLTAPPKPPRGAPSPSLTSHAKVYGVEAGGVHPDNHLVGELDGGQGHLPAEAQHLVAAVAVDHPGGHGGARPRRAAEAAHRHPHQQGRQPPHPPRGPDPDPNLDPDPNPGALLPRPAAQCAAGASLPPPMAPLGAATRWRRPGAEEKEEEEWWWSRGSHAASFPPPGERPGEVVVVILLVIMIVVVVGRCFSARAACR